MALVPSVKFYLLKSFEKVNLYATSISLVIAEKCGCIKNKYTEYEVDFTKQCNRKFGYKTGHLTY
jgi:hypothetical protein